MCIAILNTGKALPKEYLKNSWENNNQGAGMLYNLGGKLTTFKTYDKKEFMNHYYKIRAQIKGNIVLHFRIATSGYEKYTNLHPFLVNENLGFVHNGIISGLGNKQHSDTYQFNDMLKKFKHDFLTCEQTKFFIADYIGSSKLVFLDSKDRYTIINESMGHWVDGDWFSNDSYLLDMDFYYYGNKKVNKKDYTTTDWDFDYLKKEEPKYLSSFINATEDNISYIEYITCIERDSNDFRDLVEDASFVIGSSDLGKISEHIEEEILKLYDYQPN